MTEQVADAQLGGAILIIEVIDRIIARDNLERLVLLFAWMTPTPTGQRAGPNGMNANLPPFRGRVNSFGEDEPKRPVLPIRRPHLEFDDGYYDGRKTLSLSQ